LARHKGQLHIKGSSCYANPGVRVTSEGRLYLQVALGTDEYSYAFVASEVRQCSKELESLATIANSLPHAAQACVCQSWHESDLPLQPPLVALLSTG